MSRVLTGLLALMLSATAFADNHEAPKPPKIFTQDRVIEARVEAPWSTIERLKDSGQTWEGIFRYNDEQGQEIAIPIEITTRGLTRKRVCDFPPLRFRFNKEAAKGTAFRGAGRLKLVTHCFPNLKYEQYYVKEYLAYRIYNLMTDRSFRVQPLQLGYAADADSKPFERFAFLIEDIDDVAERNGMEKLGIEEIGVDRLDPLDTSRFMLFQYLIANLDWSVLSGPEDRCCHNGRLIGESDDAPIVYPVPYDFDSSGIVNAHYAAPPAGLKVRNVRQRLYRGFCSHQDTIAAAMEEYRAKRPAMEALVNDDPSLDKRSRKYVLNMIEEFYEDLASDDDLGALSDNCRG